MPKNKNQSGIIHLWLILIIIGIILGAVILSNQFKPWTKSSSPVNQQSPAPVVTQTSSLPTSTSAPQQVKKGDMAALEKYCKEEALKLPEAPFTYESKEGPTISGPMPWVSKYIPENIKQSARRSCTMAYKFVGRTAYSSVGTSYPGGLVEFHSIVYEGFAAKLDSSWKKTDPKENVFKRENSQTGTVDFVDIFDGGLVVYIKFNTYYK